MNKRSIISLLLAVLMIIGAFPMTAFAADTDTLDTAERDELPFVAAHGDITPTGVKTVTAVNMSVIAPTVGSSPYYSATVPNGSGYVVYKGRDDSTRLNGVIWTDSTDSKIMSPTDTFKAGHTYTANVYISAQSGYQFSVSGGQPSVSASINGLTAQTNSIYQLSNTQYIAVYASFTLKPNENLSTLYLGVITKPAPGAAPSYTASPLNAVSNYTVDSYTNGSFKNGVSWRDATNYSYLTPGTDRFIPGHQYEVTIRVKAKPGYQFSTSTKTMIGYDNAYFNLFSAGDYTDVLVKHTYTCPEAITSVAITGVTAPKAGSAPSYSSSVSSSDYAVSDLTSGTSWHNGIIWFDGSGKSISNTDKFKNGETYTVRINLTNKGDKQFMLPGLTATVNGKTAKVASASKADSVLIDYTFTVETVSSVEAAWTIPEAGESPVFSATVPSGKGYKVATNLMSSYSYLNGIYLYDNTAANYPKNIANYKMIAGHSYTVTIALLPTDDSYAFSDSVPSGELNGSSSGVTTKFVTSGKPDSGLLLSYTFTCKAVSSISQVEVTVKAPVEGETRDYNVTVPSGKGYKAESYDSSVYINGVCWCEGTDSAIPLSNTDKFVGGQKYTVRVYLVPSDGSYEFSPSVTGKINGSAVTMLKYIGAGEIYVEYTFTCPESTPGKTVSGKITSYLSDTDDIKLTLTKTGETVLTAETTVKGNSATYSLEKIPNGMYALTVEKKDHVSRDYYVSVTSFGGNITLDIEILPLGDVTGDGKTNVQDCTAILRYVRKIDTDLSDYQLKCADVAGTGDDDGLGDAKVNVQDVTRILRHVRKIENLC